MSETNEDVQKVIDLVRQITQLCKDDQVRVRIAAGAFEMAFAQSQGLIPTTNIFQSNDSNLNQKIF